MKLAPLTKVALAGGLQLGQATSTHNVSKDQNRKKGFTSLAKMYRIPPDFDHKNN